MARNGAGVMSIVNPDFVPNTTISSSEIDANFDDIADEITNSLPRDGQAGMSGALKLADGAAATPSLTFTLDTNSGFYRVGADNIGLSLGGSKVVDYATTGVTVTGAVSVSGDLTAASLFALSGDLTPAQITADQNDYTATGLSSATVLRLSTDASRTITGIAGGTDGRVVVLHNVGSNPIILADENASSTASNRFALPSNLTLRADESAALQYDSTSARWRVFSHTRDTFVGDSGSGGVKGLVPAPATADATKFLRGDATWADMGGATLLASATVATAVATIEFTDIPATYGALHLYFEGLSHNNTIFDRLLVRASVDNGSSYDATGYLNLVLSPASAASALVASGFSLFNATALDAKGGVFSLSSYSITGYKAGYVNISDSEAVVLSSFNNSTSPINALQILTASATSSLDAGSIHLYGVR